eukprot:gb/GECH01014281.1/.p1 GENE.gb/GECH01014281.1/~~gb/GECH01014281.1/.p1  ORF type:complete len:314 (+),score=85.01 gb/GECH01014281.1/:1-942(+)
MSSTEMSFENTSHEQNTLSKPCNCKTSFIDNQIVESSTPSKYIQSSLTSSLEKMWNDSNSSSSSSLLFNSSTKSKSYNSSSNSNLISSNSPKTNQLKCSNCTPSIVKTVCNGKILYPGECLEDISPASAVSSVSTGTFEIDDADYYGWFEEFLKQYNNTYHLSNHDSNQDNYFNTFDFDESSSTLMTNEEEAEVAKEEEEDFDVFLNSDDDFEYEDDDIDYDYELDDDCMVSINYYHNNYFEPPNSNNNYDNSSSFRSNNLDNRIHTFNNINMDESIDAQAANTSVHSFRKNNTKNNDAIGFLTEEADLSIAI